jgi:hypothetical protein
MPDSAVLSPDRLVSRRKAVTWRVSLLEISVALDGQDAKLAVRRELTKSNLLFDEIFSYGLASNVERRKSLTATSLCYATR